MLLKSEATGFARFGPLVQILAAGRLAVWVVTEGPAREGLQSAHDATWNATLLKSIHAAFIYPSI